VDVELADVVGVGLVGFVDGPGVGFLNQLDLAQVVLLSLFVALGMDERVSRDEDTTDRGDLQDERPMSLDDTPGP
jgi:hypothetical protein